MIKDNELQAFFAYFFCIVVYFVILGTNEAFLTFYLSVSNVSHTEYDRINYYKILGYIFAALFLLLFSRFISLRGSALLGLTLYILSMIAICTGDITFQTNFFYFSLYSAGYIMIGYAIFLHLFCDSRLRSAVTIICICFAGLVSFFINKIRFFIFSKNIINDLLKLTATNICLFSILGLIIFSFSMFKRKIEVDDYNFRGVVKHSELEILCGFTLFYILMIVTDGYAVYSITDQLFTIEDVNIHDSMMLSVLVIISLLMIFIKKLNVHLVNIIALGLSLILFITINLWAENKTLALLGWFVLGLVFSIIVICNILVLTRKFEEANLSTAVHLYLLGCSVGYYCGYITINTSENTLGENGFLVSVCFVLFSLLAYYIYFFKKYRLWQWKN